MTEVIPGKPRSLFERLSQRRHQLPEQGEITLHRRRVYILPTRYGLTFSLLLLLMLVGSINYNNNLGYAFTFLFGSITTLSMLFTHRNIHGLGLRVAQPEPVFATSRAYIDIHLRGNGRYRFAIQLQTDESGHHETDVGKDTRKIRLDLPATTRGLHRLPRIKCFTEYPYGLFHAWSWITPAERLLVYPAPELTAPPLVSRGEGESRSSGGHPGGRDDFHGLRDYRHGDPRSHIAWKREARHGDLVVKLFAGQIGQSLIIDWSMTEGLPTETRLSRLARWILDAANEGLAYGLVMPGKTIDPATGEAHMHACLKALALFDNEDRP